MQRLSLLLTALLGRSVGRLTVRVHLDVEGLPVDCAEEGFRALVPGLLMLGMGGVATPSPCRTAASPEAVGQTVHIVLAQEVELGLWLPFAFIGHQFVVHVGGVLSYFFQRAEGLVLGEECLFQDGSFVHLSVKPSD